MPNFDTIVLGAGAMGSATAYYHSLRGQKVLLLEQFDLTHQKGSSQDHSRIIRYSYDNPIYIKLMKSAYPLWSDLQDAFGQELYARTGGIDIGTLDEETFVSTKNSLKAMNIPHEILAPAEAQQRFPQFIFTDDMEVIYQSDSGILAAARCVKAHVELAQKHGAVVKSNTPVSKIIPHATHVEIHADEVYHADKLVITAGSWMNNVLAHVNLRLPLVPVAVQLAYFEPDHLATFDHQHMPVFITHLRKKFGDWVYGIPSYNNSGIKVAFHGGKHADDVSQIDYEPSNDIVEGIRRYTRQYLPGANAPLKSTRICLYTMTPDEDFIVDFHPEYPNIIIGSICSGHGFKFSTLMGSILTDLATTGTTAHDISLFNINRFL